MPRKQPSQKVVLFVEEYCKTASATKAALAAGYPPTWARQAGNRLLRTATVQDLIGAKNVNRGIHAEETYRNTIAYTNAALQSMADAFRVKPPENATMDDLKDLFALKTKAIDAAGRALERMGKIEGLYVERVAFQDNRQLTLQRLIEEFSKAARVEAARPVIDVVPIEGGRLPSKDDPPPPTNGSTNGNGHHEGNGHDVEGAA